MSNGLAAFADLNAVATHLRDKLAEKKYILLFAYNGTGKTRLSMAFKDLGKKITHRPANVDDTVDSPLTIKEVKNDTLYFNAFTEDLFSWDNDLEKDSQRVLTLNSNSRFFHLIKDQELDIDMDNRIRPLLSRYADFDFRIEEEEVGGQRKLFVTFSREVATDGKLEEFEDIKISRGEENIFIWCFFLAVAQLAIDGHASYDWVKYIYVDDPISSLDDNNAIAVASHLAQLLQSANGKIKAVISSHHALFFNVMWNELNERGKNNPLQPFFLNGDKGDGRYTLRYTNNTPFFHHVALLKQLHEAVESDQLYTYHFNVLRSLLEKTASFHGFQNFSACIKKDKDDEDGILHARLINVLSHGNYSLFEPREMLEENKQYFKKILNDFMVNYRFNPELFPAHTEETAA